MRFKNFLRLNGGATVTDYGILVGVIALVLVVSLYFFGDKITYVFSSAENIIAQNLDNNPLNTPDSEPVITTTSLSSGTYGVDYNQALTTNSQGSGGLVWSVQSGVLPPTLTLNPQTGVISGTLMATSTPAPFTIAVRNAAGKTATREFILAVTDTNHAPTLGSNTFPDGRDDEAYSQTVAASDVDDGDVLTWTTTAGELPTGLTLNSATGLISGNPSEMGWFSFAITVSDQSGASVTGHYTIRILHADPVITISSLPNGIQNQAYTPTLIAATGYGGVNLIWNATGLPSGLSVDPISGILSGTPTNTGSFVTTMTVTDSQGGIANADLSLTVGLTPMTITTNSLPSGTDSTAYSKQLSHSDAHGATVTWTATGIPDGITLTTGGLLAGAPSKAGSYSLVITAKPSVGAQAQKTLTLEVSHTAPAITLTALPDGKVDVHYTHTFAAIAYGDSTITSWDIPAGQIPAGLSFDVNTGVLSGTPQSDNTYAMSVSVTDSADATSTHVFNLKIAEAAPAAPVITTTGISLTSLYLTDASNIDTQAANPTLAASAAPGATIVGWNLSSAPAWLSIDANGKLHGLPVGLTYASGSANVNFSAIATDSNGTASDSKSLSLIITHVNPALTSPIVATATTDAATSYSKTLTGTVYGGLTGTWSLTGAPSWLTINSTTGTLGLVSGQSPVFSATAYSFTVHLMDGVGQSTASASIAVSHGVPIISTSSLNSYSDNSNIDGQAYAPILTASLSGGVTVSSWTIPGNPYSWLSITNDGKLHGVPSGLTYDGNQQATISFNAKITDSGGGTTTAPVSFVVAHVGPVVTTGSATLASVTSGSGYSQSITGVTTYGGANCSSASAPAALGNTLASSGLNLSCSGNNIIISGTAAAAGTYKFGLKIIDTKGGSVMTSANAYQMTISSGCSAAKTTLNYTGSNQVITVPANCRTMTVKTWGGGGMGGVNWNSVIGRWSEAYSGGTGGYAKGTVAVTPGASYTAVVGAGGGVNQFAYAGGGVNSNFKYAQGAPSGGDFSGLFTGSVTGTTMPSRGNAIIIAGGGGGGGAGGWVANGGNAGASGSSGQAYTTTLAGGGTVSAGGQRGGNSYPGLPGASLAGGKSHGYSGGGGAGYNGGGGGGSGQGSNANGASAYVGGGGGGANYIIAGASATVNSGLVTSDTDYAAGVGLAGAADGVALGSQPTGKPGSGGNGRIVILWGN